MKSNLIKFLFMLIAIFYSFTLESQSENNLVAINEVKESKANEWPNIPNCFGQEITIRIAFINNTPHLTFKINGITDNGYIGSLLHNKKIKIKYINYNGCNSSALYSEIIYEKPVGEIIQTFDTSEEVYLKATNLPPSYCAYNDKIIVELTELDNNCNDLSTCSNEFLLQNLNGTVTSSYLDPTDFEDCTIQHNIFSACQISSKIVAEDKDRDVILKTKDLNNTVFQNIIYNPSIYSKIYLMVKGKNGNQSEIRGVEFWNENMSNFNPNNWTYTLPDFSSYNEYLIKVRFELKGGSQISCGQYEDLPIINRKSICDPISFLRYSQIRQQSDGLMFNFDSHFLFDIKENFGISEASLTSLVQTIEKIDFKLEYTENGVFKVQEITKTQSQLLNFKDLNFVFQNIDFSDFSGILKIKVTKLNGAFDICEDRQIIFNTLQDPPLVIPPSNCDPSIVNASNLNPTLYMSTISVGDIFFANNFPVVITKINSGSNSTGINGTGVVPLPFQNKQALVDLVNVQFNIDKKLIRGHLQGVTGTNNLNLSEMPIRIGGKICVPPPPPAGWTSGGVNNVTGLNKYGFDPKTGLFRNGNVHDYGGFNINGIHKDTGQPYNKDGCTRDGVHYQTGEKCDPSGGGTPPGLEEFISTTMLNIDSKLILIIDSLIANFNLKKPDCSKFRTPLLNSNIKDQFTAGANNELINEGAFKNFTKLPEAIPSHLANRKPEMVAFEKNHIDLIKCDVDVIKYLDIVQELTKLKSELPKLKDYIRNELKDVKEAEFAELKTESGLRKWLAFKILNFIRVDENWGTGALDERKTNFESPYYDMAGEVNIGVTKSDNQLEDEVAWLYNQGVENIFGIHRSYYTKAIIDKQKAMAIMPPNVSTVLPIEIVLTDKPNSKYTVYIEQFKIYPQESFLNVTALFKDKTENQTLAFGGTNIPFFAGGVNTVTSKIYLKNDIEIKLLNSMELILKQGQNYNFIEWNCNGITNISIGGKLRFCSNFIVPLENDLVTVPNDSIYELDFVTQFQDWLDFTVKVKGKPFYLKGLKSYPIELDTFALDMTKLKSLGAIVPVGYEHEFYDASLNKFDPLWKGCVLHNLKVHLPNSLFGSSGNGQYSVGLDNAVFDDNGFSGLVVFNKELMSIDTGQVGKWAFSISGINILFLQNNISGGGFNGKVRVPILKEPLSYIGVFTTDKKILLKVEIDKNNKMPAFFGSVTLEKNSFVRCDFDATTNKVDLQAKLSGYFTISSDSGLLKRTILPSIKFEDVYFSNDSKKYFSKGKWGLSSPLGANGAKPNMQFMGLEIDSIFTHNEGYEDRIYLGINFQLDVIDSILNASGGIDIVGKMEVDEHGRQVVKHNSVRLRQLCIHAQLKSVMKLDGCVQFYENHIKYGTGLRGALLLELAFMKGVSIEAAAQFGKTNQGMKYFFVDLFANTGDIATIGPVTFTGFGGGLSRRMYPTFENGFTPMPNFSPATFMSTPIGTTLTGIVYEPDPAWGYEFKLMTKFKVKSDKLITGTGEIAVRLTAKGSLGEIELRATAAVIAEIDLGSLPLAKSIFPEGLEKLAEISKAENLAKPTSPPALAQAAINGFLSLKFNVQSADNPTFHGTMAAYLNAPGMTGAGTGGALAMIDMHFEKSHWYIYIGRPEEGKRCGIKLNGPSGAGASSELLLESYLNVGTVVPPFPGLPKRVAHLGKEMNISEGMRSSGTGIAFGASLTTNFNMDFYGVNAAVNAGLGFDLMLRKYKNVSCSNNSNGNIGIEGWYAMGQMWAFIEGSATVLGFPILQGGVAAVLQAQLPNPTWIRGRLELKVESLIGDKDISAEFEIGQQCQSSNTSLALGMEIITSLNAEDKTSVNSLFKPAAVFAFPLDKKLDVPVNNITKKYSFKINEDSTGIFYNGFKWESTVDLNSNKSSLIITPLNSLPINDSIIVIVKVDIYTPEGLFGSQVRKVKLYTGDRMLTIPKDNIEFCYPIDGMSNFYKEENINRKGYMKLSSSQGYLFNDPNFRVRAKLTKSGSLDGIYSDVEYNFSSRQITYDLNPDLISNQSVYKLELVSQDQKGNTIRKNERVNENVLYTAYFRTSAYNTFKQKMDENNQLSLREQDDDNSRAPTTMQFVKYEVKTAEKFDKIELEGESSLLKGGIAVEGYSYNIRAFMSSEKLYAPGNQNFAINDGFERYFLIDKIPTDIDGKLINEAIFKSGTMSNIASLQLWSSAKPYVMNTNLTRVESNFTYLVIDFDNNGNNSGGNENESAIAYFGISGHNGYPLYKYYKDKVIDRKPSPYFWNYIKDTDQIKFHATYTLPGSSSSSVIYDVKASTQSAHESAPGKFIKY